MDPARAASLSSPVVWDDGGPPRSRAFGDVYFSSADGLAESRAVFLAGCGLPEAWRGRDRFCVGELGFGTGLNILALLDLWGRTRGPGARLSILSIEAYPMSGADARRALGAWPDLSALAGDLTDHWPRAARGFHRLDFPTLGASLDLAIMDVEAALDVWSGRADAWFLDGFSPAANPDMWSETVLGKLAARSAPGARAATFTVAGAVRRGLEAAGFAVEKRPGFGRKRERLEAVLPSGPAGDGPQTPPRVAIIGAGVAGAALARAFAALGSRPLVLEAKAPGAGASGNPAALVMPRLDAGGGAVAALYAQAFARAVDLYEATPGAVIARQAIQLESGLKDPGRFDRIAADPLFAPGAVDRLTARAASAALGEPCVVGALAFDEALAVEPAAVLAQWLSGAQSRCAMVSCIEGADGAWTLYDETGRLITSAEVVCLANAEDAARFAPSCLLSTVRGQISVARTPERPAISLCGGYAVPARDGVVFGATHDRDDSALDVRSEDHRRNLVLLAQGRPALAARLADLPLSGRASLRAVTPDFLPLAGPIGTEGLYVLSGLGSRGFCAAPLLAEHVAALALGAPSPLPADLAAIVEPARFARRRATRGRPTPVAGKVTS